MYKSGAKFKLSIDSFNIHTVLGFLYHVEMGLLADYSIEHEDCVTLRNVRYIVLFQTVKKYQSRIDINTENC